MEAKEFDALLGACAEIAEYFPDGLVFIGGIAVYLHSINHAQTQRFAETTHDGDFYISLVDMGDLRDIEEVTPNRRLSKHQLIKKGFEFDIYTERQSTLVVPYDAVSAEASSYGGIKVASLEHLFVLKLEAFLDRKGSTKGEKDAKDLMRITAIANLAEKGFRASLCSSYLRDEHLPLLGIVEKGPFAMAMAKGNAVEAKKIRAAFSDIAKQLRDGFLDDQEDVTKPDIPR